MDAGGAFVRRLDHEARRMRAAAAPFCGPKGRLKQPVQRPNVDKTSRQDAGVGLARPNFYLRAAGRGVGAQPAVHGRPHAQPVRTGSSAGMDAGGALVDRAPTEPAGCGRPVRHYAARRAA